MKKITFAAIMAMLFAMTATDALAKINPAWSSREIVRPLLLPRGMIEFTGGMSWIQTGKYFDDGGVKQDLPGDYTEFLYNMGIAVGVYDGVELRVSAPYVQRSIDLPGDPAVEGFGDLDATLSIRIFEAIQQRPTFVMLGVRGIFPTGESEIGDADELAISAPARGTFAVGPFIAIRETYGNSVAMRYYFEWDFYLKGEQEFMGVTAKSDYGDIWKVGVEATSQLGDSAALKFNVVYTTWNDSEWKVDGLRVATMDDAYLLEVRPALQFSFGSHFDLILGTSYKALGKNSFGGWPAWGEFKVRF